MSDRKPRRVMPFLRRASIHSRRVEAATRRFSPNHYRSKALEQHNLQAIGPKTPLPMSPATKFPKISLASRFRAS